MQCNTDAAGRALQLAACHMGEIVSVTVNQKP